MREHWTYLREDGTSELFKGMADGESDIMICWLGIGCKMNPTFFKQKN